MSAPEGIPLWDSVTHPFAKALELAFGCHHTKLSRVFTIHGHSYKVCCDCGATFNYSLENMSMRRRRKLLATLRGFHAGHRIKKTLRKLHGKV